MTRAEFDGGWKMLEGVGWPGKSERNPEVYFGALGDLSAQEWQKAVATAIRSGAEFHPVPKKLREMAGAVPALSVEAASAFEQVCAATVHRLLHQGQSWCSCTEDRYDVHLIRERLGDGAADAFLAAGGAGAILRRSEGDPFLLQRFSAAYVETVSVDPQAGVRMLEAPAARPVVALLPEVTLYEARAVVEKIADLAGMPVRAAVEPLGPSVVVATDERLAILRDQARAITSAGNAPGEEPIVDPGGAQEAQAALCAEVEP